MCDGGGDNEGRGGDCLDGGSIVGVVLIVVVSEEQCHDGSGIGGRGGS